MKTKQRERNMKERKINFTNVYCIYSTYMEENEYKEKKKELKTKNDMKT